MSPISPAHVSAFPPRLSGLSAVRRPPVELTFRSWHLSMCALYLPAWILVAIIWQKTVFTGTPIGLFIILYIITGLSIASWSQLVVVFFKNSSTLAAIISKLHHSRLQRCNDALPILNCKETSAGSRHDVGRGTWDVGRGTVY